jgi:hypothetical protein
MGLFDAFRKKEPNVTDIAWKQILVSDLKILLVPLNENIVQHLAKDLIGLAAYRAIGKSGFSIKTDSGKVSFEKAGKKFDYEKTFLENYEKTKAITLFRKLGETGILPRGEVSLIRNTFRNLFVYETPIIASWIAANEKDGKKVADAVKKTLRKTKDPELDDLFSKALELAATYKKILKSAAKKGKSS